MAYVLGYVYADGAVEDLRKSSRTCYFTILSVDRSILVKIKRALGSNHLLYLRKPRLMSVRGGKTYVSRPAYILRIGNKIMYQDLINLGLKPRKSLDVLMPNMPAGYFFHFLRGYCDGDGCIYISKLDKTQMKLVFTTGSPQFAKDLNTRISELMNIPERTIYFNSRTYRLAYRKKTALPILQRMYENTQTALYLDRKHKTYLKLVQP